ncbi:5486_t:CDS:2, partial [Dentiscutata heterogama]
ILIDPELVNRAHSMYTYHLQLGWHSSIHYLTNSSTENYFNSVSDTLENEINPIDKTSDDELSQF